MFFLSAGQFFLSAVWKILSADLCCLSLLLFSPPYWHETVNNGHAKLPHRNCWTKQPDAGVTH